MKSKFSRRSFLWLAGGTGASLVFKPGEKSIHELIPYVNAPEYPKPGEWSYYSAACRECPAGCGLLMTHRDGRVTKAEGNPNHQTNQGKLCIRGQSSVQGLYDRDRLQNVQYRNHDGILVASDWQTAFSAIKKELDEAADVRLLSDLQTGSLAQVMDAFSEKFNQKTIYYEAFNYESMRRAHEKSYGENQIPRYHLKDSDLIVSFGADFLETWLSPVEHAENFADLHILKNGNIGQMIYFGPVETMTAVNSDLFVQTSQGEESNVVMALIKKLHEQNFSSNHQFDAELSQLQTPAMNVSEEQLEKVARAILKAKAPIILAGRPEDTSAEGIQTVQAVNLLNELLGNQSRIDFSCAHALSKTAYKDEVHDFFNSISEQSVVIIYNANPVFSETGIAPQLQKAKKIIYVGTQSNETSDLADWILPTHYYLEDWGDYEAWSGKISLMQPTMRPIFKTQSAGDIFLELADEKDGRTYKELVRENWKKWGNAGADEASFYKTAIRNGYLELPRESLGRQFSFTGFDSPQTPIPLKEDEFNLRVLSSAFLYDGKLANRGWLQEIPNPVSNVVWQSWIDINPEKAQSLGIEDGEIIKVTTENQITLEVPVRYADHLSPETLAIETGQGHWAMGKIANGVGINAFALLDASKLFQVPKVSIEKTGKIDKPLMVHPTLDQHSRELLKQEELNKIQEGTAEKEEIAWPLPEQYTKDKDLYKGHGHKEHRWGMVIDLQSCIGCKACEAACYAENNVPIVGRENVAEGREMSWLKVVPYKDDKEHIGYLPTPCQHCDSAPCEPVCPVFASVHTEEGLNAQIYNRCIGTRYCSNNCPYKVRRFNWKNIKYDYPENLRLNPEVTVRSRGVMEKCTFCIQRIKNKEHHAKVEHREMSDGEVVPACAQTCPTNAIVFGDLLDQNSRVRNLMDDERRYQLLHELNTKPAVVYLKKIDQKI